MLNREFSLREKLMLIVCLVLATAIFYYQFVHKGIGQQIRNASTQLIQEEIMKEQNMAATINKMMQVIEENDQEQHGKLSVYNNLGAEISYIGSITSGVSDVNLVWNNPILRGTTVRRSVRVSFVAPGYEEAKQILNQFVHCPFRCLIQDMTISDNTKNTDKTKKGLKDGNSIQVSFTATFFETTEGATTTEGLVLEDIDTDPSDGKLVQRSKAYADNK